MNRASAWPGPGEVLLREADLDDPAATGRVRLSPSEAVRARRLVREVDARRWRASRSFLRRVLAELLDVEPAEVPLEVDERGRTRLRGDRDLRFSLSRRGPRALVALTVGADVGVDLEAPVPEAAFRGVPERCFTPAEQEALRGLPEEARPTAFAEIWTRKEAAGKARGVGLAPSVLALDLGPADRGLVRCEDGLRVWSLPGMAPGAAALAVGPREGALDDSSHGRSDRRSSSREPYSESPMLRVTR